VTRSVRTELLKIRTTRLVLGLLAFAAALTTLRAVLSAAQAGGSGHLAGPPLDTADGLTAVLTGTGFALLMAAVFGVIVATGEFRHQTATDTYLGTPDRSRVLTAKALAAAAVGVLFGLVAATITTTVGLSFAAAQGYPVTLSAGTIVRYALGAALGGALLAAAGVGVGSLVRNQLAAIIGVFAWGFLFEQVVGGLFESAAPYLPFTAAGTLAGAPLEGAAGPLPFAVAAVLVAAVAALLSGVAARTAVRADIS
jgi:ABC-2 type transport system permease protein